MVALLKLAGIAEIVVVILAVELAGDGIAIDIWVVLREQESQGGCEFQTQRTTAVELHRVATRKACSSAFAFPSAVSVESDAIGKSVGIHSEEGSTIGMATAEVATHFKLKVAYLEELIVLPVAMVGECKSNIISEMSLAGEIFQLDVSSGGQNRNWAYRRSRAQDWCALL